VKKDAVTNWFSRWYLAIQAEIAAENEQKRLEEELALLRMIAKGPPDPKASQANWESWCRWGYVRCPGTGGAPHCGDEDCRQGAHCAIMLGLGLFGDGSPVPRRQRVKCGAQTRQGSECMMAVVPGKARCRLHGGLSTGPKTIEGRRRIAEAQRRRWRRARGSLEA
jgi:hypothetical protein